MRETGRLVVWLVGTPIAVVVLLLGVRYLTALLDLHAFGIQGVLEEIALRRGGRLEPGSILQPYPALTFEVSGLPALLQIIDSGGVDDFTQWLTLKAVIAHTGCPPFTLVQRPRGRLRQTVATGDPAFDGTWMTISKEAAVGEWLLADEFRRSLLGFAARAAVPVTGVFAKLLRLRPAITRKTIRWDGERMRLAEALQVQSVDEIESFLVEAGRVLAAFRETRPS